MSLLVFVLLQITIIAYALVAGVFLAFSDFIMRSLKHTPGTGGADAMQSINREVFRWVFMVLFLGLVPVSVLVGLYGGFAAKNASGALMIAAGIVYVVGCFGVTVLCNVPMNNKLEGMDTSSPASMDYWVDIYLPRWTFWNSVRTAACIVSASLLIAGVFLLT